MNILTNHSTTLSTTQTTQFQADEASNRASNIVDLTGCYHLTYVYVLFGWHRIVYYILVAAYIMLALPTVLLNISAFLVFRGRKFKKQPSNMLIMSSTIADLLTGAISLPLGFANLVIIIAKRRMVCLLYAAALFPAYSFCVLSFMTVFYTSVDRYLAVFYPFFYAKMQWQRVYLLLNIFSWIFTFGLVASSYLFPLFKPVFIFLSAQPFLIALNCAMMIRVWRAIRRARKADLDQLVVRKISGEPSPWVVRKAGAVGAAAQYIPSSTTTKYKNYVPSSSKKSIALTTQELPRHHQQQEKQQQQQQQTKQIHNQTSRRRRNGLSKQTLDSNVADYLAQLDIRKQRIQIKKEEQRTSRITSFMLGSVCVCYLPYFVIIMWWIADSDYSDLSHTLGSIAIIFVPIKALLNPVLNFYTMPSMRRKIKNILFKSQKGRQRGRGTCGEKSKRNSINWRSTVVEVDNDEITATQKNQTRTL